MKGDFYAENWKVVRAVYYVSIFIAVTSYIGNFVQSIMESVSIQESLVGALNYTAACTILSMVGVLIAKLLKYGLKKEV